jgi:hypothetical protein
MSAKTKTGIILLLISAALLFSDAFASDPESMSSGSVQSMSGDSAAIKINEKIFFYQAELKKNTEVIQQLEEELKQRRALNERLSGAIAASQEILQGLQEGAKDFSPQRVGGE